MLPFVVIAAAMVLLLWWIATKDAKSQTASAAPTQSVRPAGGIALGVEWSDLGKQLVEGGAIDAGAFEALYSEHGGLSEEERALLHESDNGELVMTEKNSGLLLNLLWSLGLANKNPILTEGEMSDPRYETKNFASTGGWTLAKGNVMDHYAHHAFIELTGGKQQLVDTVSKTMYRPCCNNSAHFPDCNHGMAMLGLLERLAGAGASEERMYAAALAANSYWFPDAYDTIEAFAVQKGVKIPPKERLSAQYSSASGYARVAQEVSGRSGGGSSCSA